MSLTVQVDDVYGREAGSAGFMLVCACLVFFMTPGVGLLYSGLSRSKNALNILYLSFAAYIIVAIQWYIIGFSLSFSENGSGFIGNGDFAFFRNMGSGALRITAPGIPVLAFAMYQLQFATVTVAIIFGSVAERCRILPAMLFMFFWVTLVYSPVASWTWSARGWLRNLHCLNTYQSDTTPCGLGSLDFAGGGPVHMTSGFAGLAYALKLGSRNFTATESTRPHNMVNIYIGTAMVWFGWLVFNGGSGASASVRGVYAFTNTVLSSSIGGIVWSVKDYMVSGRWSTLGIVSGILAGLVGVTPASGYVAPWGAIVIGIVTSIACNYACSIKLYIGVDDALDAFAVHGTGGFVGTILTGIFSTAWVTSLDGTASLGGVVDGQGLQLGYQIVAAIVIPAYSFVVTYGILVFIEDVMKIPLRPSEEDELDGVDICDMGEIAYDMIPQEEKVTRTVEVVSS